MAFDFGSADFYNADSFTKETARIFDICNGCRLCFNLCPSFDVLFKRIDELDGDLQKLAGSDTKNVVDLCYDCKLCFPKCPYTPPHHYMLDFPRLMLRGKALEAKKNGVPLRDRVLSNTDLLGKVSTNFASLVNWSMGVKPFRILMEMTIGIHRERNLPAYSKSSFASWYKKHKKQDVRNQPTAGGEPRKVVFFHTCSVNYNDVETGKASIQVLEKNGIRTEVPEQKCCGMPYLDGGDIEGAKKRADYNLNVLAEYVKQGYDIISPGPSCSYMIKQEYPLLSANTDAKLVASHTYDVMEYLAKLNKEGLLAKDFAKSQGDITYHLPCHLKAQNIGFKSRDVLELIPDTRVEVVAKCSGHDGTWSLKKENFKMSLEVGKPLFDKFTDGKAAASDCPLAQLQIEKGSGKKPRHPIQILRDAYGMQQDPKD